MVMITSFAAAGSAGTPPVPIYAPVVHLGPRHVLSCGSTRIVLDGSRGLALESFACRARPAGDFIPLLAAASFRAELVDGEERIVVDQAFDKAPRLQVISQGSSHVSARAFFNLFDASGRPFGNGTMDFLVLDGRAFLLPSVFIDAVGPSIKIVRAGWTSSIAIERAGLNVKGKAIAGDGDGAFVPFGLDKDGFWWEVSGPGQPAFRLGWLRNVYPPFPYLKEIDRNPETDDLYEAWPLWAVQRGQLRWKQSEQSGLSASFRQDALASFSADWLHGSSEPVPASGHAVFTGVLSLVPGADQGQVSARWTAHERPLIPKASKGRFRYYNEIEGLYEVDAEGGAVDLVFDARKETADRTIAVRFWNLKKKSAAVAGLNGRPVALNLLNDSDLVEDPLVFIVKEASGPAARAMASVVIAAGKESRLTLDPAPGLQFVYQMYSALETWEAWSEACSDRPLFQFHQKEGTIYQARLPGRKDYAFFKLPFYMVKSGLSPTTLNNMNELRGFAVRSAGPEAIEFEYAGVNLRETGLSRYSCRVPNDPRVLRFEIVAEFRPLDDVPRWTSLEYCDLYPFDGVPRENFHYKDVVYLDKQGLFDRVGTGAWGSRFAPRKDGEDPLFWAEVEPRTGPGSRVPDPLDGSVWILGDNPDRGNVLYRRGEWSPTPGTTPAFTLCNAWVDIHNVLHRKSPADTAAERIKFTIDVFGGPVPALADLNSMYRRAGGTPPSVRPINAVDYDDRGAIRGFRVPPRTESPASRKDDSTSPN